MRPVESEVGEVVRAEERPSGDRRWMDVRVGERPGKQPGDTRPRRQPARSSSPAGGRSPAAQLGFHREHGDFRRGVLRIERQPVEALRVLAAAFTLPWGPAGKTHQPARIFRDEQVGRGRQRMRKLGRESGQEGLDSRSVRVGSGSNDGLAGFGARAWLSGSFGSFGSPASSARAGRGFGRSRPTHARLHRVDAVADQPLADRPFFQFNRGVGQGMPRPEPQLSGPPRRERLDTRAGAPRWPRPA